MSILEFLWYAFIVFLWVAFLFVVFFIVLDIFRDHGLNGWFKALWIIALFIAPPITALVYLIFRGKGMAERSQQANKQAMEAQQAYIKQVAGTTASDQISQAKGLLDSGAITQEEFDKIKAKALASS